MLFFELESMLCALFVLHEHLKVSEYWDLPEHVQDNDDKDNDQQRGQGNHHRHDRRVI